MIRGMNTLSRLLRAVLLSLTFASMPMWFGCASMGEAATTNQPSDAGEWVRRVTNAYDSGGQFASLRVLRFDYVLRDQNYNELTRARHLWDRNTGDYRYEADASQFAATTFFDESSLTWKKGNLKLPAGSLVAILNMKSRAGKVFINGKEQSPTLVKYAFDRVDNDAKWLLLPLQLTPPTRTLYVNTEKKDGKVGVNLAVSTPDAPGSSRHDLWIVTVDPQGKIQHTGIRSPGSFLALVGVWDMDQAVGGVTFCTHRFLGEKTIVYESLGAPASADAGAFSAVSPMLVSPTPSPLKK